MAARELGLELGVLALERSEFVSLEMTLSAIHAAAGF